MTKTKAQKHLKWSREHLVYLRESYVEIMRDPNWKRLDCNGWIGMYAGGNPFRERLEDIRKEMEETKARIAKFERIVLRG